MAHDRGSACGIIISRAKAKGVDRGEESGERVYGDSIASSVRWMIHHRLGPYSGVRMSGGGGGHSPVWKGMRDTLVVPMIMGVDTLSITFTWSWPCMGMGGIVGDNDKPMHFYSYTAATWRIR